MSVYIITDRAAGTCKIGYSLTPRKRVTMLRTASHADLRLEAVIPGDRSCEQRLHAVFEAAKLRREWFAITPQIEDLINRFAMHLKHTEGRRSPIIAPKCATPLAVAVHSFLLATGQSPTAFGAQCLNDRHFVRQLFSGRDVRMSTVDKVQQFMAAYQPEQDAAA